MFEIFQIDVSSFPWLDIFWGLFISGILLTLLSLLGGLGEEDSDLDMDADFDVDADIDSDVGFDVDADADVDLDIGDVGATVGGDIHIAPSHVIEASAGAPFMLLFGGFLLIYGALGVILFQTSEKVFEKLGLMTLITFGSLWLLNLGWKKLFKMTTYDIPTKERLVGKVATVVFTVDDNGGTIKVDIGGPKGFLKFPAIPAKRGREFKSGERVVIKGWSGNFALVDEYKW